MPRHFVCLTFDFDNASPMIAREMTTPTMISRGDFGMVASERLLALMGRHGIRTTWFTPGHTIETCPAHCRAVHAAGHEIAHHGWTHRVPATLGRQEEERDDPSHALRYSAGKEKGRGEDSPRPFGRIDAIRRRSP